MPRLFRLRNANILLVTMRAIANEIAKNLVLSGIGSLTVQDDQLVVEEDLGAQFLVSDEDVGRNVSLALKSFPFLSLTTASASGSRSPPNPQTESPSSYQCRQSKYQK